VPAAPAGWRAFCARASLFRCALLPGMRRFFLCAAGYPASCGIARYSHIKTVRLAGQAARLNEEEKRRTCAVWDGAETWQDAFARSLSTSSCQRLFKIWRHYSLPHLARSLAAGVRQKNGITKRVTRRRVRCNTAYNGVASAQRWTYPYAARRYPFADGTRCVRNWLRERGGTALSISAAA